MAIEKWVTAHKRASNVLSDFTKEAPRGRSNHRHLLYM